MLPILLAFLTACGGTPSPTVTPTPLPTIPPTILLATPTSAPTATPIATATIVPPTPIPTVRPTGPVATAIAAGEQFVDPQGRFVFVKPAGWVQERQQDPDILIQLNSDRPPGSFNVSTEMVPPGITLAQYIEAGVAQVRTDVRGYEPGPRGTQATTLGNEPAGLIDYFSTVGGTKLYFMQIIVVKGDTTYVLTFNTQPADMQAYLDQAQVVLMSWRFS